jgi:heme-degrading monooxygenase HmoA
MFSRHWKGITKADLADRYIEHLQTDTFPQLSAIPGFIRASILRREVPAGTEFRIVTEWESMDAIEAFAGENPDVAVVPPKARELLLEYDRTVVHYEVAYRFAVPSSRG